MGTEKAVMFSLLIPCFYLSFSIRFALLGSHSRSIGADWGSKGGEAMGSIPGVSVKCRFFCCWFWSLRRDVFLLILRCFLVLETNTSKFQFNLKIASNKFSALITFTFKYLFIYRRYVGCLSSHIQRAQVEKLFFIKNWIIV